MSSLTWKPEVITTLETALCDASSLLMTAHVDPDGDSLGALLALKEGLELKYPAIGRIDCVTTGKIPDIYHFLPGIDQIQAFDRHTEPFNPGLTYDIAISLDCGALSRLGAGLACYQAATHQVNIDHHISNNRFGTLNLVFPEAAASCQVVESLLEQLGIAVTQTMATNLYAGLYLDTESFQDDTTSAEVFDLAARLVRAGANPYRIATGLTGTHPMGRMQLHAHAMLQSQRNTSGSIIWTVIYRDQILSLEALDEHIEGIVDMIKQVQGVRVAAFFKERRDGRTKVSLRSNHAEINVAQILHPLGGGGHRSAAAVDLSMKPDEAVSTVIPLVESALAAELPGASSQEPALKQNPSG